jgi:hypothetical protein
MARPEVRKKFMTYMDARDISGENNPFFGKHHTEEMKRAIGEDKERSAKISSKKRMWWADGRKGKTYEELYGNDVGIVMRRQKSERMSGEKNPAYGHVYQNAGYKNTKVGYYKGKLFRGIWEYSFYKHLEREGIDLSQVEYEPLTIEYTLKGRKRTYHPDFLVKPLNLVVEVKNVYALEKRKRGQPMLRAKKAAAEEYCSTRGLTYRIMTERDFRVIAYSVAYDDPYVEWIRK